jgi:hypothetical protein
MTNTTSTHSFLDLPLDAKRRVDRVCLDFERAPRPARVEDFLDRIEPEYRDALLVEMIALDVELRKAAGESPTAVDYLARFPDKKVVVRAALRQSGGPAVGDTLGRYELTGVLGRGGMGVVFEAADPVIGRSVAIKVLPERLLADQRAHDRLLQEARHAGRVHHPNVVTLFGIGEADGAMFLILERVVGGSAADRLKADGPFDWRTATRIAADVCRGLAAIHAAGFLHLDVKPGNILLPSDGGAVTAKLTDFSLAMAGGDGTAALSGTPAYMSPEQRTGAAADARTDVFGAGAALFALLTGKQPFAGTTVTEVVAEQVRRPDPDPRDVNPDVPEKVAAVVRKAMAPDPAGRYPTADAMLRELDCLLAPCRPRGRRVVTAAAIVVAVLFTVGVVVALRPGPTPTPDSMGGPPPPKVDEWEQLIDGPDLKGWQRVPARAGVPAGEMAVVEVNTSPWPVLRASGTGVAAIETEREFENYHLRFEYKWAEAAGLHQASVRYHCVGPVGTPGTHGMILHMTEAGSYRRITNKKQIELKIDAGELRGAEVVPVRPVTGATVRAAGGKEAPFGKWNQAALVCVGDWMVHVLNGVPVVALARSRRAVEGGPDEPLTKGRIRFQSLVGEVHIRKVEIRRATAIPAEYLSEKPEK